MALLTHVTFRVLGRRDDLEAFDPRLKVLLAEHEVTDEITERHTADALHYDLKAAGGIPFPPFALASGEFPEVTILVEWFDAGVGARGSARIIRGALAEQTLENVAATAGADYAAAISLKDDGNLALALAAIRTGSDEWRGYVLTGTQDALFLITRDPATGAAELLATQGEPEWSRAWSVPAGGEPQYRALEPAQPIADRDFRELEKLAQNFVAEWIWFGSGPREEIAIELERYQRMGYAVSDANLRSAALHRIAGVAPVRYSTLDADSAWIEGVIARCWPGR